MRKVVISGMGILSPLGRGLSCNWSGIVNAKSCISKITAFDISEYPSQIAAQIPMDSENVNDEGAFNPLSVLSEKDLRRLDEFITYSICAGHDALKDSGWAPTELQDKARTGVIMATGIGGIKSIYEVSDILREKGPRRVSPFFIPTSVPNMASGHLSVMNGFMGPNTTSVTACASAAYAISEAARMIILDEADVMLTGGTEAAITPLSSAGFASARALSTHYNDTPELASRPWDKGRDGFVLGEGAGALVLEEMEHAKKRGAKIYAELSGFGASSDGHHITAPDMEGTGASFAMKAALKRAHLNPEDIGYINAHATSTVIGDVAELAAIRKVFGNRPDYLSISSTKSVIGHLLGAAAAVEAIYSVMALNNGVIPPTANLTDVDEQAKDFDLVPVTAKEKKINHVLSNSFGFGGSNAALIFSKV